MQFIGNQLKSILERQQREVAVYDSRSYYYCVRKYGYSTTWQGDVILNGDERFWFGCRSVSRGSSPPCGCGGGATPANRSAV